MIAHTLEYIDLRLSACDPDDDPLQILKESLDESSLRQMLPIIAFSDHNSIMSRNRIRPKPMTNVKLLRRACKLSLLGTFTLLAGTTLDESNAISGIALD